MHDEITIERIITFHPDYRDELRADYLECNNKLPKGVRLRFSYVYRTDEEQDELYALGRTVVNPKGRSAKRPMGYKVTNAKAGQSDHNYGLAFDIVILFDLDGNGTFETASWKQDKYFKIVVDFFKSKGYTWGGDWSRFIDKPHFQKNYTWEELQKLPKFKDELTGIYYPIL